MIWRCPGCGAGFPKMEEYEEHARGCSPLHRGETKAKSKSKRHNE